MKSKNLWGWFSIMLIIVMLLSACNFSTLVDKLPFTISLKDGRSTDEPFQPEVDSSGVYGQDFADYPLRSVDLPDSFTGGYDLPLSEGQVAGLEGLEISAAQRAALLENGFVVVPPDDDPNRMYTEFYQAYESYRYNSAPVFITTDSVFHVYHLIFDKMLRDLEKNQFITILHELTSTMLTASAQQHAELEGTNLEEAAARNVAFFAVAADLLGLRYDVPTEIQTLVDRELGLIEGAAATEASPIWTVGGESMEDLLIEDYSQYIPRGHYTRSEALERYFRAMMWYGRLTYRLKIPIETQRALLMVQAMKTATSQNGLTALELWQNIYDPTVFIVGKADDLSIHEYGALSEQIFGANPTLVDFGDEAKMDQFYEAAKTLPPPQINSMWVFIWQDRDEATQGFRFMGQRFTLDQYVFGQLIYRMVGTLDDPRGLPKGLDLLAAMGSDEAYQLLEEMGETHYENFDTQMTKVKGEIAGYGLDSWTQNLYWAWLYAMQPLFEVKGEQYPAFMQTQAWLRKDMSTALSTWAELKHDTILYSKQVMAEMGGGAEDEPPQGYVEPNPEAFARLLALAQMTRSGLLDRGLLDETTQGNLDNLIDELEFLLDVSEKELNGVDLTDEEYWRIQYYGGWLEALTIAAADPADEAQGRSYLEDQKSAVIADVASGYGMALEEGVGYPTNILVISPVAPYPVTVGAVYTYYEFPVPVNERMTDEAWREMLESGNAPAMPFWTETYIVP
jgi:hypothetical protein